MKLSIKKANAIFLIFLTLILIVTIFDIDPKLVNFINENFTYFLIIYLISLSFLIYEIAISGLQNIAQKFQFSNENRELVNKLKKLTYEEKNILAIFMNDKAQEKPLDPNDQTVA